LFAAQGQDLRPLLRGPQASEQGLRERLAAIWAARADAYSEQRERLRLFATERADMHVLGG
jgi:molybdenum cofactor biosynthesis enzyme MoaA